ncbi:MAG: hypothetical protein O3A55_04035 [Bacteroidetes bacterium]|nr:hypothetical protein [Bacteroidota bacterium]
MKKLILIILFTGSIFAHDAYLKAKWNKAKTGIEIKPVVASYFETKEVVPIKNHTRLFDLIVASPSIGKIEPNKISPDSTTLCEVETSNSIIAAVKVQPRDITLPRKSATQYFMHELGITGDNLKKTLEPGVDSVYEVYERILKTVAATSNSVSDSLLGLPLEIVIKNVSVKKNKYNGIATLYENGIIVKKGAIRILSNGKTKLVYTNNNGEIKFSSPNKNPILFAHIKLVKNSKINFNTYWTNTSLYFL